MHRGFDLITPATSTKQTLSGWISYTIADKALEDENVDVFACRSHVWKKVGTVRTNGEGHFSLSLTSTSRLPIGLRDMYVSVQGDRTGVRFLAYVAPEDSPIAVSDVDGTLTSSENAFPLSLVGGGTPDQQPNAASAYKAAATRGIQLVYVTARGNRFTADTRAWLASHGFPLGPVRLTDGFLTLPGADTIAYKTNTITALSDGFDLVAGVGNRDSDITAYTNSGVAADRIYIKLPEFQGEVQADLAAHKAVGFTDYATLKSTYVPTW
jgi:phosphatidate phosphatase PAH1